MGNDASAVIIKPVREFKTRSKADMSSEKSTPPSNSGGIQPIAGNAKIIKKHLHVQ